MKRLLAYVGLPDVRVDVRRYGIDSTVRSEQQVDGSYRHLGAAAWFGGLNGRTAYFGCAEETLAQSGEELVGGLAHEVAHAYRHAHRLNRPDRVEEEQLTDLTTVFLGSSPRSSAPFDSGPARLPRAGGRR